MELYCVAFKKKTKNKSQISEIDTNSPKFREKNCPQKNGSRVEKYKYLSLIEKLQGGVEIVEVSKM